MKPTPYRHLAALVRQKRESYMTEAAHTARLASFLRDAHTATLNSVRIYGWWELYDLEEIRLAVTSEIEELRSAFNNRDYHSKHGVIQEAMDCIVVLSKAILRMKDMADQGEL